MVISVKCRLRLQMLRLPFSLPLASSVPIQKSTQWHNPCSPMRLTSSITLSSTTILPNSRLYLPEDFRPMLAHKQRLLWRVSRNLPKNAQLPTKLQSMKPSRPFSVLRMRWLDPKLTLLMLPTTPSPMPIRQLRRQRPRLIRLIHMREKKPSMTVRVKALSKISRHMSVVSGMLLLPI